MGKRLIVALAVLMFSIGGAAYAQTLVTLDNAITQGVSEIEERLPLDSKVVALNFSSTSQRLSNYVIEEIMTHLVRNGKLIVVDRANIEFIRQELNFQMSGEVSDESARSIGRILGAEYIISGAIEEVGSNYVIRFRTISVESAALQGLTRIDVRRDSQITNLLGYSISDVNRTLILSAGAGGVFRMQLMHQSIYESGSNPFKDVDTSTSLGFGVPVFVNVDLLSYFSLDAAMFYSNTSAPSDTSWNSFSAIFSLYLQSQRQGRSSRLTTTPLLGISYEMNIWRKMNDAEDEESRDELSKYDSLYLKLGGGLNYSITDYLRLSFRVTWDLLLYRSDISNESKTYKENDQGYLDIRHGPNVFLGMSYMFLKI